MTKEQCIYWLKQEIADGDDYLRKNPDSADEIAQQRMRLATLALLQDEPRADYTQISSPSALCGLLGCSRRDSHAHTVMIDR